MTSASSTSSRDPQLPKGIRTRWSAIERSIDGLARAPALDSRERDAALRKIHSSIERFERYGRQEGIDVSDLGVKLWREASQAHSEAQKNYRRHHESESSRLRGEARERQPSGYEKELSLMRGRDRSRGRR